MSDKIAFKNLVEEDDSADSSDSTRKRPGNLPAGGATAAPIVARNTGEVTPLKEESKRQIMTNRAEGLRTIVLLFVVVSFGITVALAIEIAVGDPQIPPHGGVASGSEICSEMGLSILKKGGNAVDAAITTMLCVNVAQPQSGGLGGGGGMLIRDEILNKTTFLDFRESSPAAFPPSLGNKSLRNGGLSVGVPGELLGMMEAHKLYGGGLSWSALFAPVIKLAEDGFQVTEKLANDIGRRIAELDGDKEKFNNFRRIFLKSENGEPYSKGDIMIRKDLASLFRKLAQKPEDFYQGAIAKEIVQAVKGAGGLMELEDLKRYSVKHLQPLVATFKGFNVFTAPAPFSGSLLLYILNEMEKVDTDAFSVDYFKKLAKVLVRVWKCRNYLGDPYQSPVVQEIEQQIANKSFLNDPGLCEKFSAPDSVPEDHGTSHVSVVDKDELFVSATTSLNIWFGSLVVTDSGIVLNNELDDFVNSENTLYNKPGPNRRPLSSMVPTLVDHPFKPCQRRISIGGVNGTRITSSVAQTLISMLSFNKSIEDSVKSPKLFCDDKYCEIEKFENYKDVIVSIVKELEMSDSAVKREKYGYRTPAKKLAMIAAVAKVNSDIESYADESLYGKGVKY